MSYHEKTVLQESLIEIFEDFDPVEIDGQILEEGAIDAVSAIWMHFTIALKRLFKAARLIKRGQQDYLNTPKSDQYSSDQIAPIEDEYRKRSKIAFERFLNSSPTARATAGWKKLYQLTYGGFSGERGAKEVTRVHFGDVVSRDNEVIENPSQLFRIARFRRTIMFIILSLIFEILAKESSTLGDARGDYTTYDATNAVKNAADSDAVNQANMAANILIDLISHRDQYWSSVKAFWAGIVKVIKAFYAIKDYEIKMVGPDGKVNGKNNAFKRASLVRKNPPSAQ